METENTDKSLITEFNGYKYRYYERFEKLVILLSTVVSAGYFVSDCFTMGTFFWPTFVPRFSVIVSYMIYQILRRVLRGGLAKSMLNHVMGHAIMWHTLWAIYYLEDRSYVAPGMIVVQLMIMYIGFASPRLVSCISHIMVIVNFLISSLFISYSGLSIIISIQMPLVIAFIFTQIAFSNILFDKFKGEKRLEGLSYIDSLTGAYNRHKINQITREGKFNKRADDREVISVAMFDIDDFKEINDKYGHDEGDEAVKYFANAIRDNIKPSDVLIRWGGEEFVVVFYGLDEKSAYDRCEIIRQSVIDCTDNTHKFTVSGGVTLDLAEDYNETVKRADEALYFAKKNGKNQVVKYSELPKIDEDDEEACDVYIQGSGLCHKDDSRTS